MDTNVQIAQAWPFLYEEVPHVAFCKLDKNEGIYRRPRAHSPTPTIYICLLPPCVISCHTYTHDAYIYTHAHRATCAHTFSPATHPTRVVVTWLFTSWRCAWRFATQVEGLVSQMGRSHRPRNRFVLSPGKNTVNFNH